MPISGKKAAVVPKRQSELLYTSNEELRAPGSILVFNAWHWKCENGTVPLSRLSGEGQTHANRATNKWELINRWYHIKEAIISKIEIM